jgi:hypothetical protein
MVLSIISMGEQRIPDPDRPDAKKGFSFSDCRVRSFVFTPKKYLAAPRFSVTKRAVTISLMSLLIQ